MGAERTARQQQLSADADKHDGADPGAGPAAWRWSPRTARITGSAATVLLTAVTALLARDAFAPGAVAWWLLGCAALTAAASALLFRRPETVRGAPATLAAASGVLAVLAVWTAADAHQWSAPSRVAGLAVAGSAALVLLGLFSPVGRSGPVGAMALAGLAALWWATLLLTDAPAHAGAAQGVIALVVLGVLPRAALTGAGLAAWGNRPAGASVSRLGAGAALAVTHRGLVGAALVAAASATAAGWLVGGLPSPWAVLFTTVLAVVMWARSRAYPLVIEVVLLRAGAVVLLVRLVAVWMQTNAQASIAAVGLLGAAAVLSLAATAVTLPDRLRTRLSRGMDLAEPAGFVVLLPLAVGVFGTGTHLPGAF
ncbi:type VII secretion integral membrane protein EccD [Streptomyces meridianus]